MVLYLYLEHDFTKDRFFFLSLVWFDISFLFEYAFFLDVMTIFMHLLRIKIKIDLCYLTKINAIFCCRIFNFFDLFNLAWFLYLTMEFRNRFFTYFQMIMIIKIAMTMFPRKIHFNILELTNKLIHLIFPFARHKWLITYPP